MKTFRKISILAGLLCAASLEHPAQNAARPDGLPGLIDILVKTEDPQLQLDILTGLNQAWEGRRSLPMPPGWDRVEAKLEASVTPEIRTLARVISVRFGSAQALASLRQMAIDASLDAGARRSALQSLLNAKDPGLPPVLQALLSDPSLRAISLRGLAVYDDPKSPAAILAVYGSLNGTEQKDALNTLASRVTFAKQLMDAVKEKKIAARDLTAELVRQLRNLKSSEVDDDVNKVWGLARETTSDRKQEIEKYRRIYRAGGSTPGDAGRGRAVFAKLCQQCHTLFDTGGKVGPNLTGSNRADLDYLLQNILDPNAVIPNDYRSSTVETKDDRILTGIVRQDDDKTLSIITANETVALPRNEVKSVRQSDISMMPEGLLAPLADQEARDLIYYLSRPGQVPLVATQDTIGYFFNGKDLSGWNGDTEVWSVDQGEIIGRAPKGLKQNEFLKGEMILGDFRLVCEVKLTPNKENSGIQFRSEVLPGGEVKGYQADAGAGWWGKLYEERGREILWDKSAEAHVKQDDWNTYEIVAVGSKILTALNGHRSVDLDDPAGARQGLVALQAHAGGAMEVRFRNFRLELNPKLELTTSKN